MERLDRVIICVLAIGVWALVLKPDMTTAHDDNYHSCSGSGSGYGEANGGEVYVHSLDLSISCNH